ncbi:MAG TPA: DUF6270 domain-containing protein [Baekduia sp.]|nr:DUF6270 domain-containing protein [Baekduia sp.]
MSTAGVELPKVAIFGSCVTRDLFEDDALDGLLSSYTARCSVISTVAAPVALDPDRLAHPSPWQRRAIIADFHKTFFSELEAQRPDWLVIDLIDERFDLLRIAESLVTNSSALQGADTQGQHSGAELVRRSSHEGRELFLGAAEEFVARVTQIVPAQRIVLHRALWCPRYRAGDAIRCFEERRAEMCSRQNEMLGEGYDALRRSLGTDAVEIAVDPDVHLADEQHRWELEPFHYEPRYNRFAVERLTEVFERR